MKILKNQSKILFACFAFAFLAVGSNASAATIAWDTPTGFTDDSVILSGNLVYAVATGSGTVVNNVGAQNLTFGADDGTNVVVSTGAGSESAAALFLGGGGSTGNAGFDTVLNSGDFNGFGGSTSDEATVTLKNLTIGTTYEVQLFAADTRDGAQGRLISVDGGTEGQYAYLAGTPFVGADVTGTFVASAATQTFTEAEWVSPGDLGSYQINGIVLDSAAVPEPSTLAYLGLGATLMFLFVSWRRKARA